MRNLKKVALATCLAVAALPASSAVFIVAHPDDHMLLMGPNMVNDIVSGYPTVIVIVTAGDATNGISDNVGFGSNGRQYNAFGNQYYRVRLQAHMAAIDNWIPGYTGAGRPWVESTESFSAKIPQVEKWALRNVVLYHLNLPDNTASGLQAMKANNALEVADIRGINRYTRETLKETIRQIIARNNRNTPNVVVNYHEPLPNSASPDHVDHTEAGAVVRDAIYQNAAFACLWEARYPGYVMGGQPVNVPQIIDVQRRGYELAHTIMAQRGNVIPWGGPVSNPNWMQSVIVPGTNNELQYGAMDGFHTGFYGKSYYAGARQATRNCAF